MNKYNQKHLTISDRLYIEQELLQGTSFKAIAKVLHKDPTTISKEVKRARTLIPHDRFARKCKLCHFYSSCSDKNLCHKIKKHPYLTIVTLVVRNAIDGILRMNAQTFLNSLVTNALKHLMCVIPVKNNVPVF